MTWHLIWPMQPIKLFPSLKITDIYFCSLMSFWSLASLMRKTNSTHLHPGDPNRQNHNFTTFATYLILTFNSENERLTLWAQARHCFSSKQSPAFFLRPDSRGLSFKSSHLSLRRRLKDSGRVVSWLPRRSRCWTLSRRPKLFGSSTNLFLLRSILTRWVKVQKLSGRRISRLLDRSRWVAFGIATWKMIKSMIKVKRYATPNIYPGF